MMRKLLILLTGLLCVGVHPGAYAHKEWVHQYMVQQAYLFLENQLGQVTVLKNAVNPFLHGPGPDYVATNQPYISIGAWREDVDDWVYGYGDSFYNGVTPSITHFWKGDAGDDAHTVTLNGNKYYENAWEKARVYLFCNTPRGGPQNITVPFYDGYAIKQYQINYTSLPDLYKGNYYLEGISNYDGSNYVSANHTQKFNPAFGQPAALSILGRVAHLLGDMSVPAHVRTQLHPCPAGLHDFYEEDMGNVYYHTDRPNSSCSDDPGGNYRAQQWTASTAAQTGGFVDEMYCANNSAESMLRYLFYTNNQLADFFPCGVTRSQSLDPSGPLDNSNPKIDGNDDLSNGSNPYLQARYQALRNQYGGLPSDIVYQDIANETFNYSIRAVATLFQWFAYNSGIIQSLDNKQLTSTNNNYLLCGSGTSVTLTAPSARNQLVNWSIQPAGVATGMPVRSFTPTYRVTANGNYNGPITVSISYTTTYGPNNCYNEPVTLTTTLWDGLPNASVEFRDPTDPVASGADFEPGTNFGLIAAVAQANAQGNLTYAWSTTDPMDVGLSSSGGNADVMAPRDNSHFFTITVAVTNLCGTTTASRNFRTKDPRPPGDDCLVCPSATSTQSSLTTGGGDATGETNSLKPGLSIYPNPSTGGFNLYYVRAAQPAPKSTPLAPTFSLLDVLGRQVTGGVLAAPNTHVDTSTLADGLYLLKVVDNGYTIYKRVQTKR